MLQVNKIWGRPDDDGAEGRCFSAGVLLREPSQRICLDTGRKRINFFSQIWEEQLEWNWEREMGFVHSAYLELGSRARAALTNSVGVVAGEESIVVSAACDVVVLVLLQGLKQFSGHASSPSSTDNCNL
jgi:hypothetical protein